METEEYIKLVRMHKSNKYNIIFIEKKKSISPLRSKYNLNKSEKNLKRIWYIYDNIINIIYISDFI